MADNGYDRGGCIPIARIRITDWNTGAGHVEGDDDD